MSFVYFMAKAKGVLLILVDTEKTFKEVPGCKTALYLIWV